jgi:hypothetical protein
MENQDKKDEFIRKLVGKNGPDKAPGDFTDKLMGRIKANPVIDDTPLLSAGTWIGILAGLAAVIVMIFMLDMSFLDKMFSFSGIQQVSMNIFSDGFFKTMSAFFTGLNISSTTVVIIAAATGLIILERLLHKRFLASGLLVI